MVVADRDLVDRQALALELASARSVSAPVRKAVAAITTMLLVEAAKAAATSPDGTIPPQAQAQIRAALNGALATLSVDIAAQTTKAVTAAVALAIRQETPTLQALDLPVPAVRDVVSRVLADPVLNTAGQDATRDLARTMQEIARYAQAAPLDAEKDVQALAARASSAVSVVERDVRSVTNRAINETTRQVAATVAAPPVTPAPRADLTGPSQQPPPTPPQETGRGPITPDGHVLVRPGLRVVWMAERDACLTCLRLSGSVIDPNSGDGFNEDATFGKPGTAPSVWPPGMPLMRPPRHPNCRCRLRIIAADNVLVPQALRREAERSVARGWSDYASRTARLSAADRLLHRGSMLPRTVQERAARDVARGRFSTRHKPRSSLRAD